ncbi:MAG: AbrB/MazE/SpoVT family DNA-binding domain-containing protein [Promethearchaeota archaeon]
MITIPKEIREKYNIKQGRECSILVLEGQNRQEVRNLKIVIWENEASQSSHEFL